MNALDDARAVVCGAERIAVLTGAGVSAESGIPTFRDALTGLWTRHDPQHLATREGFLDDPELVWRWYASRRARVAEAMPNAAHTAIARLQTEYRATIVTQNVDGLHARAGAADVLELHGNIVRAKCLRECGWSGDASALELADARVPPACPECGALARPDVVWFGESLPENVWLRAEAAFERCDVCLVVGTSALVHPAAGLPLAALRRGAKLVVVNLDANELDALADVSLHGRAAALVPALLGAVTAR